MGWFENRESLRQQIWRELLFALPDDLPGIAAARQAEREAVGLLILRDVWEQTRREQWTTRGWCEDAIQRLSRCEEKAQELRDYAERLRGEMETLKARALSAERNMAQAAPEYQREQSRLQQEIRALQEQIAAQNRLLARQILQEQEAEENKD